MNEPDILFFALLAGFILYKLYTVLGRDDYNDSNVDNHKSNNKPTNNQAKSADNKNKVVNFPNAKVAQRPVETSLDKRRKIKEPEIRDVNIAKAVDKIRDIEPNFTAGTFLEGAKYAFEMVIDAFSAKDKDILANLLSKEVYKEFAREIDRLEQLKQTQETTLITISQSEIINVKLTGKKARITVEFASQQVDLLKDADGDIMGGSPQDVQEVQDSWVFERNLGANNPNWTIIST